MFMSANIRKNTYLSTIKVSIYSIYGTKQSESKETGSRKRPAEDRYGLDGG